MTAVIIGGGAAGLYAASLIPGAVIIERNAECGRKLLLTGGGRCNYTHKGTVPDILPHYHGSIAFIRKVLYRHTPEDIISCLEKLGIRPKDEDGKIFPLRGDAQTVRDALLGKTGRVMKASVLSIERNERSFRIITDAGTLEAEKVILAAGGNSYPATGSDGSGFRLASSLGHSIVSPRPALAPLEIIPSLRDAEGITAEVVLSKGKTRIGGSAVITKRGISGPAAENFSRFLTGREEIRISFGKADIAALRESSGKSLVKNVLPVPPRLAAVLLGKSAEKKVATLSKQEAAMIEKSISSFSASAKPIAAGAMSTAGGISTDEITPETMESKLVPGLYFAGEIIDVDADCGGYSLTWAFASAYTAAMAIRKA